jgi:hypothetical protein
MLPCLLDREAPDDGRICLGYVVTAIAMLARVTPQVNNLTHCGDSSLTATSVDFGGRQQTLPCPKTPLVNSEW